MIIPTDNWDDKCIRENVQYLIVNNIIEDRRGQFLLCLVMFAAVFMEGFEETSLAILLPSIAEYFSISVGDASWIVTVYVLFMAGLILIFGKICDKGAMKTILLFGTITFMSAAVVCALTSSFTIMLIARAAQGVGSATLWCASIMLGVKYLPKNKIAMALVATTMGETFGSLLGPFFGGFMAEYFSWQISYIFSASLGIIVIILVCLIVPKDHYFGFVKFDYLGAVLLFIAMFSGMYCMEVLIYDGFTMMSSSFVFIFLFSFAWFIYRCTFVPDPIIDLSLFRSWKMNGYTTIYIIQLMVTTGIAFLAPFFLEIIMDYNSIQSGAVSLIVGAVAMLSSLWVGAAVLRFGSSVFVMITSILVATMSLLLLFVDTNPLSIMVIVMAMYGLTWALGEIALIPRIINSVPDEKRGACSALNTYFAYISVAIGAALFSKLFVLGSNSGGSSADVITHAMFMNGYLFSITVGLVMGIIAILISYFILKSDKSPEPVE